MACILLVDDTETYLSLEQRVLGPAHRYLLARNGQQALSLARTGRPDLIVMGMSMPLMSGDEAVRVLRLDPSTAAIPVIASLLRAPSTASFKTWDALISSESRSRKTTLERASPMC